ncbi:two-component system, chemotaxis family, response regulator CheB [Sphingomonas laterariae]|uniref:protein-glutamate methylesterase n=1 Tax=Edaphosphingomonas laterariae TaxID=861865 RepID=A0A239E439_9SPHN|nr:chemotaxis-specific protein-glutamate methyltransferase CheB [Sphingomonas laterariae]SNS39520.1 two-component system, chemotaxis family, response regulator CheB [Sphingomonas laterariae]
MIVDDSIVARTVISRILEGNDAFDVVATAGHAGEALDLLARVQVDIILLDVEMPGLDGLTALPDLLARSHGARVLIVSSAAADGAVATVRALTLGAADTLLKPGAGSFAGRFASVLTERLLRIGHAPEAATAPIPVAEPAEPTLAPAAHGPVGCLAIGASTGGLHALSDFFQELPRDFAAPILVTQHLPPVFMPYFASQLMEIAGRQAHVAEDGMRLVPGELFVAPGDGHLGLVRNRGSVRIRIDRNPAPTGCLPSVDPMFAAVASVFGAGAVAVVLTGMGRDGLIGARDVAAQGGEVLAQDSRTSVVWGMPGAVANAGLAAAVLSPGQLAQRIAKRGGAAAWN